MREKKLTSGKKQTGVVDTSLKLWNYQKKGGGGG
jgi:hypothetical protein